MARTGSLGPPNDFPGECKLRSWFAPCIAILDICGERRRSPMSASGYKQTSRALPANNFTAGVLCLYRCFNFHFFTLLISRLGYLNRYVIRPLVRSYAESSTSTLSPGRIRMKFLRIFPDAWASTSCPLGSSILKKALGSASLTRPSTSIASFFAK